MSKEVFLDELAAILEVEPAELMDNFVLNRDNWDSLALVATIVLIDEQFGIAVEGKNLWDCTSIGSLWQLVLVAIDAEKPHISKA